MDRLQGQRVYGGWLGADGCESGAVAMPVVPDRKGFPHPCGSATPSLPWTRCSSGTTGLFCGDLGVALRGWAWCLRGEMWGGHMAGGYESGAVAMPDRKGFPPPCGSSTPSVAWTLCSSGTASLSYWGCGVALRRCRWCFGCLKRFPNLPLSLRLAGFFRPIKLVYGH